MLSVGCLSGQLVVVNYKKERIASPHEALRCALPRHVLHAGRSPRLPPPVPKVVLRLASNPPKGEKERERERGGGLTAITRKESPVLLIVLAVIIIAVLIVTVIVITVLIVTVFIRLVIMLRISVLLQPLSC